MKQGDYKTQQITTLSLIEKIKLAADYEGLITDIRAHFENERDVTVWLYQWM